MSARKPDPVIAAWDRLQAVEKAWRRAYDAIEKAEKNAEAAGWRPLRPLVSIAGNDCVTMQDARRSAEKLPKGKAKEALAYMRRAVAFWQQQRREAGLVPFDAAEKRANREWRDAMKAMATTRATTAAGVILKLKLIVLELRDGKSDFGKAILASAMADLSRMSKRR
jgi:hypothetical protein